MNLTRCPTCGVLVNPNSAGAEVEAAEISIIIPVYNEGAQIVSNLKVILDRASGTSFSIELIVVDDGSTDKTWEALEAARAEMPSLSALRLSRNFGKEAAICAGLDRARGAACIVIDSDLQHPPELIPRMVAIWQEQKVDVVEATKTTRGEESFLNRLGARVFYRTLSYLSGYDLDGSSDYKLIDRRVVSAWLQMHEQTTFFRGMVAWLGYKREKIYFEVPPRASSSSRWSLWGLARLAIIAVTAFSSLPLQAVTILGGLVLSSSVAFGIYVLNFYFSGRAVPGFTTVILLQLMISGALMLSLGIIGTYIARIYDEVKRRPRYLVAAFFEADGRSQS